MTTLPTPEVPLDPLKFRDVKRYTDRLKEYRLKTGAADAVRVCTGKLEGMEIIVAVQDFEFLGGSLGMAAGEAIITGMMHAVERQTPFIIFTASGGARMQEGMFSLMQMPRTTVAVQRLRAAKLPYIVVLTNPTTGGVTASYAMLGDIHIAEPGAVIGFAGARVIEQTIRERLPEGFQRAEYLQDARHGRHGRAPPRHARDSGAALRAADAQAGSGARCRMTRLPFETGAGGVGRDPHAPARPASEEDRSFARPRRAGCSMRSARRKSGCRRSSMSPARTAKVRPSLSCARSSRRRAERVHVYTSPHLVRFHERIRLGRKGGGRLVGDAELAAVLTLCEKANAGAPITFFEITTAAAFKLFSEHPADYLLLEVGLGGRLDATNVIERPAATLVTPVSIDHPEFLGTTIAEIAGEKAGILKPQVPAVLGLQQPAALDVLQRQADAVGAPLRVAGRDFFAREEHGRLIFEDERGLLDLPLPRLVGRHQHQNAAAAIATLRGLEPQLSAAAMEIGVATAEWPARLQRLRKGRVVALAPEGAEIWLDGAHNEDGARVLAQAMADCEDKAPRPLVLICGTLASKDTAAFLRAFKGLAQEVLAVPVTGEHVARRAGRGRGAGQCGGHSRRRLREHRVGACAFSRRANGRCRRAF